MIDNKNNSMKGDVDTSVNQISRTDLETKKGISGKEATQNGKNISQDTLNPISTNKCQKATEEADKSDSNSISNVIKPVNLFIGKCKSLGVAVIDYDISRFSNIYNKYEVIKFIYDLLELYFSN